MIWRDFIYIRKSDRRVILFFLVLLIAAIVAFCLFNGGDEETFTSNDSTRTVRQHKYGARDSYYKDDKYKESKYYAVEGRAVHRFPFDPNTADSTALLSLGLQPWQVRNIYKYRAKGGIFRRKQDFARVYGLTVKEYRELAPYIRIGRDYQSSAEVFGGRENYTGEAEAAAVKRFPAKLKAGEHIDLNAADTSLLMRVPGIGPYYARQITYRRERLGGYYSVQQLLEIEGMPEEALSFFTVKPGATRKLNVNKLSLYALKRHPYINYYQAKEIVEYRRQRGAIHDLSELRLLQDFTPKDIERLREYVEY